MREVLNMNEREAKRMLSGILTTAKNLLSRGWRFKIEGIDSFSLGITGSFSSLDAPFDLAGNKIAVQLQGRS